MRLEEKHRLSFKNKRRLPSKCACFCCLRKFPLSAIREWTDDGQTALCPKCTVDSVVPARVVPTARTMLALHRWSFTV
jgi:hypothetical protein